MKARSDSAGRILRAARRLFEREGPAGVTMRRVAAAVGLSPMAIYRHFENREALLARIGEDSFESIAGHWSARAQGLDPLTRLIEVHRLYLDYALTHPHLFDLAFSMPRRDARRYPEDFRARRSPTLTVVADAVADAIAAGALREDDAWAVTMTLWAHTHGLVALYRSGRFNYDEAMFRDFYERSLQRLFAGLQADRHEPARLPDQ
ncbi:TetR/AcrR family transcriptional regulator [Marilutibacter chinensis]|uniref:TetR/AcrR family transcriptional regulator n=1 Tax=Marilutibacter chinensis TaxID=2912247 RepID=A0ABS9HXZ6_9GAMM|nr:TetR/AcrR family transcriptional regulator [Lysobacter chinensis]MCF7221237.1 TetR/AcrR family transcriptional regulator [Lysobacter chinensis]MCF7223022.1 TetR/AcrR family transcriptional regulator [Lysobacter chinensis]